MRTAFRNAGASAVNLLVFEIHLGRMSLAHIGNGCGLRGTCDGRCLAGLVHEVMCPDIDAARIAQLNAGGVPIYEEHLDAVLVFRQKAGGFPIRASGRRDSSRDAILILLGNPPREDGRADLSAIDHVLATIARAGQNSQIGSPCKRAEKKKSGKSTVPARTVQELNGAGGHSSGVSKRFAVGPIPIPPGRYGGFRFFPSRPHRRGRGLRTARRPCGSFTPKPGA